MSRTSEGDPRSSDYAREAGLLRPLAARGLDIVGAVGLCVLAARRLDIVRAVPGGLYALAARRLDVADGGRIDGSGCHQQRAQRDRECVHALHRDSSSAVLYSPDRALGEARNAPASHLLVRIGRAKANRWESLSRARGAGSRAKRVGSR